jgi:hypothetical protein
MRNLIILGILQFAAFARPLILVAAGCLLAAQPLAVINSESCLNELFDADLGKWNLYAKACNKWVLFIKEETPGPSAQAQARYREDLWKLQKDMTRKLERLQASRCYPQIDSK